MTGAERVSFTPQEARVLGALVEKAMTTPDNYPMSLNAVTVACNQVSNRDPVVSYDEALVERTLRGLADRGLAKMVHRPGDRVVKYRHALAEALEIGDEELALLAVLMLRGPQTPGELRQRTSRYVSFGSLDDVEAALDGLAGREPALVARLARVPGQKEHRYVDLVTDRSGELDMGAVEMEAAPPAAGLSAAGPPSAGPEPAAGDDVPAGVSDIERLREDVDRLERQVARLLDWAGLDGDDQPEGGAGGA